MTILTKPSEILKKPTDLKSPLVEERLSDEEKVEIQPADWTPRVRSSGVAALVCMTLAAALVSLTGVTCGLMLYRQYLRANTLHRYQGFCAVPMDVKQASSEALSSRPQFWVEQPGLMAYPAGVDSDALTEEVDIDADSETITVRDDGRRVEILHDFANNYTGIVDEARCFLMDLDPETVLRPDVFVLSIERDADFDTSRVQVSLRAALPAIAELMKRMHALRDRCLDRPVYRLMFDDEPTIRKRSIDGAPKPEFVEFSGKHIREIDIPNLPEIIEYEKTQKKA